MKHYACSFCDRISLKNEIDVIIILEIEATLILRPLQLKGNLFHQIIIRKWAKSRNKTTGEMTLIKNTKSHMAFSIPQGKMRTKKKTRPKTKQRWVTSHQWLAPVMAGAFDHSGCWTNWMNNSLKDFFWQTTKYSSKYVCN